jgi:hypothetical protein
VWQAIGRLLLTDADGAGERRSGNRKRQSLAGTSWSS